MQQKENNKEQTRKNGASALNTVIKTLKNCISISVDKMKYNFVYTESTKKIQSGSYVLSLRLSSKEDAETNKYLVFVINTDAKTGMMHVTILDGDHYAPSVLFSTTDKYPVNKLERYVPSIIASTQNMIK
jgi:hypothetical protein